MGMSNVLFIDLLIGISIGRCCYPVTLKPSSTKDTPKPRESKAVGRTQYPIAGNHRVVGKNVDARHVVYENDIILHYKLIENNL